MTSLNKMQGLLIMGIDPGTRVTGYGIILVNESSLEAIDYGCIRPPANFKLSDRYLAIFNGLEELMEKYSPHVCVIETQYVHRNVQSAIKLGMARGVSIIAAKQRSMPVFEYAPTKAKLAVVGTGKASKYQVQTMTQLLLKLPQLPTPEDAADALSLAICHAHTLRAGKSTGSEI